MTTLIWEGNIFHDVHVISPAKFYKGSVIPIDCFFDFWNIAIATNQEILNKTKRKDSMSEQGRLKIIDGDKEEVAWDGDRIDLYPKTYGGMRNDSKRHWNFPYEEEVEKLGFAIVHGYLLDQAHSTLEIEGKFDEKKLTYEEKTGSVLYEGKEFTLIPDKEWKTFSYGEETERTRRVEGELTNGRGSYLWKNNEGQEEFHGRYVHAYKKNKNGDVKDLKIDGFMSWYTEKSVEAAHRRQQAETLASLPPTNPLHQKYEGELEKEQLDPSKEELLPNYSYEKTILPTEKKYQEVLRKDTSFQKYFHSKHVWKPDKRDYEFEVVNPLDPTDHGFHIGKR